MNQPEHAISLTKQWLKEIIIGLNFCPFAKKEFVNNTIDYFVCDERKIKLALAATLERCYFLQNNQEIETSLIIFTEGFKQFESYLDLVDYCNQLLIDSGFEGVFQVASFHPNYCFEDEGIDDAANFTNRSPFPMIHVLREESLAKVLSTYKDPENIPDDNIKLARDKGGEYFAQVLLNLHHGV